MTRASDGWFGDPFARHQLRFFDGTVWTEHVADLGICSIDTTPVAGLTRSRPSVASAGGPHQAEVAGRVLDVLPATAEPIESPVLLVDRGADPDGVRMLRLADDSAAGRAVVTAPGPAGRIGRLLAAEASTVAHEIVVLDETGSPRIRATRPVTRLRPIIDLHDRNGRCGRITADRVRRELNALVERSDHAGAMVPVGTLHGGIGDTGPLRVTGVDGADLVRLTDTWEVPGARRHLPGDALLVDRRVPHGPGPGRQVALIALVAVLSLPLLVPEEALAPRRSS